MKLPYGAPLTLMSEGRNTLQVPQYSTPGVNTVVDHPDEYFNEVKIVGMQKGETKHRICVGREEGFLYFSKKGFEFFKPDLEKAFKSSTADRGHTWQDVLDKADRYFKLTVDVSEKHLLRLELEEQIKPTPYNKLRIAQMKVGLDNNR